MSDLQLALIVLGAIIIGGVVAYNWLQEKKLRQQVTSDFIVPQKDVLSDDFSIDTDAYIVDKEMAEVTEITKHFEQHTIPGEMQVPDSQTGMAKEVLSPSYSAANYIESQILQSQSVEPVPAILTEPIVKAVLHEKIQAAQVNLPDSTHPHIDLTAVLYR
jgi:FtsZ-interacting cell division protein ZipA